MENKLYLTDREVELIYGIGRKWLQKFRSRGPVYVKVGRKVLYQRNAVEEFLKAREQQTA